MQHAIIATIVAIFNVCFFTQAAQAQRSAEAGIKITGVHLHKLHETPFGIGGRFLFNLKPAHAIDAEVVYYPENPFGNFGQTGVLAGTKNGFRGERFGVFGKLRLGLMHFGGDFYELRLDRKTFFTADIGGVIEYYPSARFVLRIDAGDTILFYGPHALFLGPSAPPPLGTVHNFQPALGLSFRF